MVTLFKGVVGGVYEVAGFMPRHSLSTTVGFANEVSHSIPSW